MTGNGEGKGQPRHFVLGMGESRAGARVLNGFAAAPQPSLELLLGLPQVVPQPRELAPFSGFEGCCELLRACCYGA
jgi:hypothetical protein